MLSESNGLKFSLPTNQAHNFNFYQTELIINIKKQKKEKKKKKHTQNFKLISLVVLTTSK